MTLDIIPFLQPFIAVKLLVASSKYLFLAVWSFLFLHEFVSNFSVIWSFKRPEAPSISSADLATSSVLFINLRISVSLSTISLRCRLWQVCYHVLFSLLRISVLCTLSSPHDLIALSWFDSTSVSHIYLIFLPAPGSLQRSLFYWHLVLQPLSSFLLHRTPVDVLESIWAATPIDSIASDVQTLLSTSNDFSSCVLNNDWPLASVFPIGIHLQGERTILLNLISCALKCFLRSLFHQSALLLSSGQQLNYRFRSLSIRYSATNVSLPASRSFSGPIGCLPVCFGYAPFRERVSASSRLSSNAYDM